MAEVTDDSKVISRKNTGYPEWLDFQKLRSEGIDYLGSLAGKVWTDHNVHDPGITILEGLCYAIMDLGYRTSLPIEDILARDPEDQTADDNFMTPAKLLGNNPLNITDFRKLLIDIEGVKNAWLEVATDQHADELCQPSDPAGDPNTPVAMMSVYHPQPAADPCCINYLNGLYHVYLDLDKDIDKEYEGRDKERDKYVSCLLSKVKKALMRHRNLCEDFVDIKILCKWEIGVCAEIELDDNADPEAVYLKMVEALRHFFSPSPNFYTLPQLLEANKTIEEIMAGRPYDVMESHGFVDTEEFEALKRRRSIHISDVYDVLFKVPGIRMVERLRLRNCSGAKSLRPDEWVIKIPEDHVPEYSFTCSGFAFSRAGIPVSFDFSKYDAILEINFEHNGKILYTMPSDKLDTSIPKGYYHKELGDYSSIQADFPRVYGIAEGGLSATASPLRKAQALQLRGYLLFFDQLLADYLSQLKNLRSLFSLSSSSDKRHTYFTAVPGSVPGMNELVSYSIGDKNAKTGAGGDTGFLAFPVDRPYLEELEKQDQLRHLQLEKLPYFRFANKAEKDTAISQLQEDIQNDAVSFRYIAKADECVYCYILGSSPDYALIARKYYKDEKTARLSAESIKYAGVTRTNYRSLNLSSPSGFSFSLELNIAGYAEFLQQLAENDELYTKRRQSFLDHLLARFAEKFTDYALLSYGFSTPEAIDANQVNAKENFLSNYPLLSSARGRAFDYTADGWKTENNSGFEKRFRALLGHKDLDRRSLCNFEVYAYDEMYMFRLAIGDELSFASNDKFSSREEAAQSAAKLFDALGDRTNYRSEQVSNFGGYGITIEYGQGRRANFSRTYASASESASVIDGFSRMIASKQPNGKANIVSYKYSASLNDLHGQAVRTFSTTSTDHEEISRKAVAALGKINDSASWKAINKDGVTIGKLLVNTQEGNVACIDQEGYKIDVDNTIVGKPDKFNYELLDRNNQFKFISIQEYDSQKKGREACLHTLNLLARESNILSEEDTQTKKWNIYILDGKDKIAVCSYSPNSSDEAEKLRQQLIDIIAPTVYTLGMEAIPHSWNFTFEFGFEPGKTSIAESVQTFPGEQEAMKALDAFHRTLAEAALRQEKNDWIIGRKGEGRKGTMARISGTKTANEKEALVETTSPEKLVGLQQQVNRLSESRHREEAFASYVNIHEDSKCRFVYQLVDKDNRYAFQPLGINNKAQADKARKDSILKGIDAYNFLDLFMNGDRVIIERLGADGKTKWFHFRFSSINNIKSPLGVIAEKLVLFESVKGYTSREEALTAFTDNHMRILTLALDKDNYGEGKPISEKPMHLQVEGICLSSQSIVYIPEKTLRFLGSYPQQAVLALIEVLKSYPIRSIQPKQQAEEYARRFLRCQQEDPCKKEKVEDCTNKKEKPIYYFVLFDRFLQREDWQSVCHYETAAEAMKAFRFFLLLLKYEGNYKVDCDCTGLYNIYIREVLAESTDRFMTEQLAWGEQGVEKFIGLSQSPDAFHAYVDPHCCHSFFLACKNLRLVHPCQYDTPELRDKSLRELQRLAPVLLKWHFEFLCSSKWNDILVDFEGNQIAHVNYVFPGGAWSPVNEMEGYIDIYSSISSFPIIIDEDKQELILTIDDQRSILFGLIAGSTIKSLKELREKLYWLSCYFPFARKADLPTNPARNAPRYYIQIRLPGFNDCHVCGCDDEEKENCHAAWTSECCFVSCQDAIEGFASIVSWLQQPQHYFPVFECPCGPYGIEIYNGRGHCLQPIVRGNVNVTVANSLAPIIARNPQCYPYAEMVCEAITRAKSLVNTEGLHLVEHILLRPHCPEDCKCLLHPCDDDNIFDKCKFPYWDERDDEDPCDETKPVCFQPGHDPYSFIATIALPAWSERFRKPENRVLLENMLHREAPAHVALRIIWMTPHDLCCFEGQFRKWLVWTAYRKSCADQYEPCDFVNFLFHREFACLSDTIACEPCGGDNTKQPHCTDELHQEENDAAQRACPEQTWFEQFTELYCWKGFNCSDDFYLDCDARSPRIDRTVSAIDDADSTTMVSIARKEKRAEVIVEEPAPTVKKPNKRNFVNGRLTAYRRATESIEAELPGNQVVAKFRRFLDSPTAPAAEFQQLLNQLVTAWEKAKKADRSRFAELVSIGTRFYLDKRVFNGGFDKDLATLKKSFSQLREKGMNTDNIYKQWGADEIGQYERDTAFDKLEKIFKG